METIGLSPNNKLQTYLPLFSSLPVSGTPTLSISPLHYSDSTQSHRLSTETLPTEISYNTSPDYQSTSVRFKPSLAPFLVCDPHFIYHSRR